LAESRSDDVFVSKYPPEQQGNFAMSLTQSASRLLAVAALAWASSALGAKVQLAPVRIIAFNDVHGYLSASDGKSTSIVPLAGAPAGVSVNTGGLAYMKTLINQLQAGHPDSIVVAAGDNIGASPFTSGIAHDEPTVDILNQLGLEVSSVGNHEFDKGLTELKRIQGNQGTSTCYPPDGQFGVKGVDTCIEPGNVFNGANWTYLAANVVTTANGATIFPATYLKTFAPAGGKAGAVVGFVGLTFKNTPLEVNQTGVAGLTFGDEAKAINKAAESLKKQGANAVVVLIHQGGFTTSTVYGDTTCPGFGGDLLPVLDKLSSDVDVVVSGHTHTDYVCSYKGKLVTQSGFYGTGVTAIDLTFEGKEVGKKVAFNTPVINDTNTVAYPAGISALAKDATIDAEISHYVALSAAAGNTIVGSISAPVAISPPPAGCATAVPPTCDSAKRNKTVESAMGDLSADAYFSAFNDADIAFVQAGGVRTTLKSTTDPVYPGPISYAALFATNPFHDTLVEVSMTGPQIKRVLEQQWEYPNNTLFYAPGGVGEILMPSASFSYTWDSSQPAGAAAGAGNRVIAGTMAINGTPIDMSGTKTYRVVIQNFLQGGGDSFTGFKAGTNPVQGGFDINALVTYMKAHPNYTPVTPNRITKLGSNP
jgi:5'-nucleotidase